MESQPWRKEPRKNYSNDFKLRMVELASRPGACVAQIARKRHPCTVCRISDTFDKVVPTKLVVGTKMSYIQRNAISGRRKGCPNYSLEFKQRLVAASCEPDVSISKLALDNSINTNLLFKWRQHWRQGKLQLSSSPEVNMPEFLPITLDAEIEPANSR